MLLHPKQKYKCRECDKQFVLNLEKKIGEEKKAIIDKLLLEKISLRCIARSGVFLRFDYKNMLRKNIKNSQKNFMFKKKTWKVRSRGRRVMEFFWKKAVN